jgi:hypothetical protein
MKSTRHEARGARKIVVAVILALGVGTAWAKIPPPPPPDDKAKAAAEEKKAKDAVVAEKAKADQASAEEKAVKNFQANMKKQGKPIPKPTPVVAAATPAQPMPGPGAAKGVETGKPGAAAAQANKGAVDAKGHEKGAMTPQGNTPPKGTDTPTDAKKK